MNRTFGKLFIRMNPQKPPQRPAGGKQSRRWIPYLGLGLLVILVAAGLWPRPTPIETAAVKSGPLRASVNEEGKTRIRHRYVVSAPVSGLLRRIPLKAGSEISSTNAVVAVIDPLPPALLDARSRSLAEARRDSAAAQLERAREAHRFATSELKRSEKLHEARALSAQELEQAQWREVSTSREKTAAESALRLAEAELAEFDNAIPNPRPPVELHSPVKGRVLRLIEESSRVVGAGTPLLEVGDPTDLEVIIEVLSRDGAAIQAGTAVELEQWGGSEALKARVRYVEPAAFTKVSALGVEEQRVNVVADLLTPPEDRGNLGDQFRVDARIITWQTESTLKAPTGGLFRQGADWHAFVLENGRARLRTVKIGKSSGTEVQILDGLKEGEVVILYPGDRIREGQSVKPVTI